VTGWRLLLSKYEHSIALTRESQPKKKKDDRRKKRLQKGEAEGGETIASGRETRLLSQSPARRFEKW